MRPRLDALSLRLPALWSTAGFVSLLAAYVAAHVGLRLLVSPVLGIDDAIEAVLGQSLRWGYRSRQPPFYDWLVWGAFRLFGVSVLSLALVKYALLATAYGFTYASARRILSDPRLASLATASLLLMAPISWSVHEDLTQSVAALAACAATFYALLRLEAAASAGAYLGLGLALGLGILSKFTYVAFAAALLLAALGVERFRSRLLDRRIVLTAAVAALVLAPYAAWFARQGLALAPMYATEVRAGPGHAYLPSLAAGLYYIARVTLYYLTPQWVVFLLVFPQVYEARADAHAERSAAGRLLERFLLCGLGLLVAGALANALAYLKFRWLLPAFFLVPLYGFSRLQRAGYAERRLRWYAAALAVAEVAVVGGILLRVYGERLFPRPHDLNAPYDVVASRIGAAGFTRGTIVVRGGPLAGNLRLSFPDSRVLSLEIPGYVPPESGGGQCLIAWARGGGAGVPADVRAFLATALDVTLSGEEPVRVVEAPYRFADGQTQRVHYVLLERGAGHCR